MKYCEEYAALLDLFVDGELPPGEMEQVRAHLETCPGCRAYVDDALSIRAGFPDVEDTAVPEDFAEGVMERIRGEAGRDAKFMELRRRSVRRRAGSLAALAACCALVILLKTGYGGVGAGKSTAAPAEPSAACDMVGGTEKGISPRAKEAPESEAALPESEEAEQKLTAEQAETQTAARSKDAMNNGLAADRALPAPYVSSTAPSETVEAAADTSGTEPALRLSVEEAGDLLDGYEPIWEKAGEWCYELSTEEYRALLEALGRPDAPEGEGQVFTVLVTRSPEE